MNARMVFGFSWLGLVALLTYFPDVPKPIFWGNLLLGFAVLIWGAAAQSYFRKDKPNPEQESEKQS